MSVKEGKRAGSMCGIAGIFSTSLEIASLDVIAGSMAGLLRHRGPDSDGVWGSECGRIAFAHQRLSILDVSDLGRQPMLSPDGRFCVVVNGEIYNYAALKRELKSLGRNFTSTSDSEVVLAAIERWGFAEALQRFVGMFAIACWDSHDRTLFAARDRIGEKPFYFTISEKLFAFGSELRCFSKIPGFYPTLDTRSIELFHRLGYIPTPRSIYSEVHKLEPGTYIKINSKGGVLCSEHFKYWELLDSLKLERRISNDLLSRADATEALEALLSDIVRQQMSADVSLGAFLSGGIDSSLIAALMQAESKARVKTFSVGFEDEKFNEAGHASNIAKYLGTDHSELILTGDDARDVIPSLPQIYDEPFADSSQIPTVMLSRLASEQVKVALAGDGGDEVFGGYVRYGVSSLWKTISNIPRPVRSAVSKLFSRLTDADLEKILLYLMPAIPKRYRLLNLNSKIKVVGDAFFAQSPTAFYEEIMQLWDAPILLSKDAERVSSFGRHRQTIEAIPDFLEQMLYADTVTYLPDDLLVKVDRAAMSTSLETRLPYLDHRLIDFMWSQPSEFRISNGQTKVLLRDVLYRHVPRELVDRPKMGFGVPLADWLPWKQAR